ncbi:MAG TPA: AraC family transcriptional regulator [Chitinophaga sp.]|uniref:helix-turn-helix transcriptional regulator n=1 Tax=Chitinophaga sp. TaxID=1869181 RepID=UPI002BD2B537|nr:AraC family transcriptional regulator [Chitinophaga sp.]HVI46410.1 AraC family transcriptional regulator [Chitinophaga sp.]
MGIMFQDTSGRWVDLGEPFQHVFTDNNQIQVCERREKFSHSLGDIELVQIILPNIYIVHGDMRLKDPKFRVRATNTFDTVELHFALTGDGIVENHVYNARYSFSPNMHNIFYMPELDGIAAYSCKTPFTFLEIHLKRDYFLAITQNTTPTLERFAEKVAGSKYVTIGNECMPITLDMHRCLHEIINCRFKGGLKQLFLQSKCIELLAMQAEAVEAVAHPEDKRVLKSGYEKDCILYAREYLLEHLTDPPSLQELATLAGTNTFKLKNGFRELFNTTVFGYLNEVKLTQARELLLSGFTIKDVADQLGYSSVQHFGTAFRKKFGVSPGKAR